MHEVTQLRNGMFFEEDGTPFKVLSYDHTKMGRGNATVKLKVVNLLTGSTINKTYISSKRLEEANLDEIEGEFLYRSNTDYVFDTDDDEVEIPVEKIEAEGPYLKKGMMVKILLFDDEPLSITLPIKATYTVKEAPPDARGNSANASTKEVIVDTNMKVKTPMFIKEGDQIVVDTRTGTYVSRG